jgi:hypothetical protein
MPIASTFLIPIYDPQQKTSIAFRDELGGDF